MRRIFTFLTAIILSLGVTAQSPGRMSYQAVVRNSNGELLMNHDVGMRISILKDSPTGTEVYKEIYNPNPKTNVNGLVSVEIGGGIALTGDFSAIDWGSGEFFIKTETDPEGGTHYTLAGVSQLLSVPYALHAKTAELVTGGMNETDPGFMASPAAAITADDMTRIGNLSGINTGDQDLSALATQKALDDSLSTLRAEWADENNTSTLNLAHVLAQGNDGNSLQLKNIADPTQAQDAATKAYVDQLKGMILDLLAEQGLTDERDGTEYQVVRIGNQLWMAENLKYLPSVVGNSTGSNTTPYYYVSGYNGTDVTEAKSIATYDAYGVLYNWTAAMQEVCPSGWHLPTDAEWTGLIDFLGGADMAGAKLKATGTTNWNEPNAGATNESKFTALPGGYRDAMFYGTGFDAFFWSADENGTGTAWSRHLNYNDTQIKREYANTSMGFSVRCIRD